MSRILSFSADVLFLSMYLGDIPKSSCESDIYHMKILYGCK